MKHSAFEISEKFFTSFFLFFPSIANKGSIEKKNFHFTMIRSILWNEVRKFKPNWEDIVLKHLKISESHFRIQLQLILLLWLLLLLIILHETSRYLTACFSKSTIRSLFDQYSRPVSVTFHVTGPRQAVMQILRCRSATKNNQPRVIRFLYIYEYTLILTFTFNIYTNYHRSNSPFVHNNILFLPIWQYFQEYS